MHQYQAPVEDMMFLLRDVFDAEKFWSDLKGDEAPTLEDAEAIFDQMGSIASEVLHPVSETGDAEGCTWENGDVRTPKGYDAAWQALTEGGWVGLSGSAEYGGMEMPKSVSSFAEEMQWAVNPALRLYGAATSGAALCIEDHGEEELKQLYLPRMLSGQWTGTMALTEPQAGTDLGQLRTKAVPRDDGSYEITGGKIYTSGGEHDLAENIVHLVLARLPDAPAGTRGISLFLTPKFLADGEEGLRERNAVHCDGIEHKMGIRGSATCTMRFDAATGYMVGQPNRGLQAMFTMMNYERIAVGLQGLGAGELGYQYAAAHAAERRQGRALDGAVEPDAPADTLLVHPDVRRMLLTQRAYNEAGRAFVTYLSMQADMAKYEQDKTLASNADRLLSLLTPVSKAFMSDLGFEGSVAAQQVFGGAGYVAHSGIEQIVRDARIAQIYEGANGVIAMDLLGRRVMPDGGSMIRVLLDEIDTFCDGAADDPWTKAQVAALKPAVVKMRDLTKTVVDLAQQPFNGADEIGAAAYPYLQAFGHVLYAYMWARMTNAVSGKNTDFAEAKRQTGRFYITHLLPRFEAACKSAEAGAQPIMGLSAVAF